MLYIYSQDIYTEKHSFSLVKTDLFKTNHQNSIGTIPIYIFKVAET